MTKTDEELTHPSSSMVVDDPYIQQLQLEAMSMSEPGRTEQLNLVAELSGGLIVGEEAAVSELESDLASAETASAIADEYIRNAKELARASKRSKEKTTNTTELTLDFDRIGWIDRKGKETFQAEIIKTPELTYRFFNLISMNSTTRAQFEKLGKQSDRGEQNLDQALLTEVQQTVIPRIDMGIKTGRGLRQVSAGGRKNPDVDNSLNTTYAAYKDGVRGTANRVLVMRVDEPGSEIPAYSVVAIYDHDDDAAIHRSLYLKHR